MSTKRSLVLTCLVLSLCLGGYPEEKPSSLEHIFWKMGGFFNETTLPGPGTTGFESPLFMTIKVPSSPKSDSVYFEFGSQSMVQWIPNVPQSYWSGYRLRFKSGAIPANVSVEMTIAVDGVNDPGVFRQGGARTNKSTYRWTIVRNGYLEDYVFQPLTMSYIDSGQPLPDDEANTILNGMLDSGFDVDVTVKGVAQGVQSFYLVSGWIDVTRSVKK